MATTLEEKFVEAIQIGGAALARHEKQAQERAELAKEVEAEAVKTAEILARYGLIEPHEKEAAVKACQDHRQALALLKRAAAHKPETSQTLRSEQVDANGWPVDTVKQAAVTHRRGGGAVGASVDETSEAWRRFESNLGLA